MPNSAQALDDQIEKFDQATAKLNGAELDETTRERKTAGPYHVVGGRIVRTRQTKEGPVEEPLCNFSAQVTEEIVLDDGAETTRALMIEGALENGNPLPAVRVPMAKFQSMSWVCESWGLKAVVRAGTSAKDFLREAIQRLSPEAPQRHVFQHTGWREIDGQHFYLTATGGVGPAPGGRYEVDLGPDLARYALPLTAERPKEAMQASLRLLDVAPLTVTAPLWAGIFRAPLASAYPLDLALWLEGQTGSLKSTLAALFLSHFGDFGRTNLAQWSSTANQLERRAFLLKDAVMVIDDYAPSHLDARELEQKAARVLRAQGNLAGRGRLRSDLSERPTYHPRGLIISTGEQHPPGQSILARTILTELTRESVDLPALTEAQAVKGRLPHAMTGYLRWLSAQMPTLPALLKATFEQTRAAATQGGHLRIPESLSHLWLGMTTGLQYAESIGAVTTQEAEEMSGFAWEAFLNLGDAQSRLVADERPTRRFLTVLLAALTQGKVRMLPKGHAGDETGKADLIGWADQDFLYLLPEPAYRSVVAYCRESGAPFSTSLERLGRDLKRDGISECEDGRQTTQHRVGTRKVRVFKLNRSMVEQLIDQDFAGPTVPDVPTSQE